MSYSGSDVILKRKGVRPSRQWQSGHFLLKISASRWCWLTTVVTVDRKAEVYLQLFLAINSITSQVQRKLLKVVESSFIEFDFKLCRGWVRKICNNLHIFTHGCCLRDQSRSDAVTVRFRAGSSLQEESGARADDRLEPSAASPDWVCSFSPHTPTHQQASMHWRPVAEWPHHPHCSRAPPAGSSGLTAVASASRWSPEGAWSERSLSLSSAESFYSRNFDARPSLSPVHSVCIEGCRTGL